MSKCPFWSTDKVRIDCYSECPMHPSSKSSDVCPFKEYLESDSIRIKENIDYSDNDIDKSLYSLVGEFKNF